MPKVTNNSANTYELVTSKGKGERKTETLRPGESKEMSLNMDDINNKGALYVGAIVVEGEEDNPSAAQAPLTSEPSAPKSARR